MKMSGLFKVRHGAASGLREIIKRHGNGAGKRKYMNQEQVGALESVTLLHRTRSIISSSERETGGLAYDYIVRRTYVVIAM